VQLVKATIGALLGALLSFSAFAQTNPAETANADGGDIVVVGASPEALGRFVNQISAPPQGGDQLGRWDNDICASVTGLPAEQGQLIVDRISMRAASVGLRVGEPGCSANVFIFFVADANAFSQRLFDERREMFAYHRSSAELTRGRAELATFVSQSRPIRWWHVMARVSADGERTSDNNARSASPRPPTEPGRPPDPDGFADMQAVRGRASRVRSADRVDVQRAIIVVDGPMVSQKPLSAVGDYIAMVTLAQIEPDADIAGFPTILALFNPGENNPVALTSWDGAYLQGLYRASRNAASVRQQLGDIARRMDHGAEAE
jgi:hypothetical protein